VHVDEPEIRDDPGPARARVVDAVPRHLLVLAVGRTLLSSVGILVVYFLLPLDRGFGNRTVLFLVLGLVGVAVLVTWQARSILRSATPALRAGEAIALSIPLYLVLFSAVDVVLGNSVPDSFSERLSSLDALYFVVTTFATVGYGDIHPVSEAARALTTVQMIGDLVLIGLVLRVFLSAVDRGRRRAAERRQPSGDRR
jgi:voltage-gated potassium channel